MSEIRYWTFKHKPGETANEDKCKNLILQAIQNNYVFMQYEYGGSENKSKVTQNWNRMLEVSEGDVIFLRGNTKIYAYGYAIRPRLKADIKLKMQDIINNKDHGEFNSSDYRGIIHFEDSDVFYENLDGEENWGQRIDVDSWRLYYEDGIPAQSQGLYKKGENEYGVLKELKPEEGKKIINELYKNLGMKGDVFSLLKANHNIILTGAPGTGKTFLAKQLACLMMFGKEDISQLSEHEKEEFKEQCGFVQFHPSYDYTDFVEGLRPLQDNNGNVGFELKDGVFKEFCKKALRNFLDSKKTSAVLSQQSTMEEKYECLISKIENGEIDEIPLRSKNSKMLIDRISDYRNIILKAPESVSTRTYTVSLKRLLKLSERYPNKESLEKISNISTEIRDAIGGCNASAYWGVLNKMYEQSESVENTIRDQIQEKKYVFIIDEINRGEISKIFGELFFSIDPNYRGTDGKVRTQYANMQKEEANDFDDALGITDPENYGHFFVPKNVYIIGTMNDIDRSVESMDFAFRRRFAFKEITAINTQTMLDDEKSWGKDSTGNYTLRPDPTIIKEIKKRMDSLNATIWDNETKTGIEGLSSAYHIGASYFLKLANYRNNGTYDDSSFKYLWDHHLEGLLREYLRGMQDVETNINKLKKAYGYPLDSKNE